MLSAIPVSNIIAGLVMTVLKGVIAISIISGVWDIEMINWIKKVLIKKHIIPLLEKYKLLQPFDDAIRESKRDEDEVYTESEHEENEHKKRYDYNKNGDVFKPR